VQCRGDFFVCESRSDLAAASRVQRAADRVKVSRGDGMGTFTWLGGDIGNGNNWSSGGSTGTEPGPNDDVVLANGGHVLGLANVGQAEFTGAFVLSGANLQAGGEALSSGGSITQKDGINAIVSAARSLDLLGATYTLSGGTLSGPQATEFVSGTFKQFSGTNTIGEIEIKGGHYTLTNGALAVVSGGVQSGLEFVGLGQRRLHPERRHAHGRASAGNRLWRQR
jgi:hypothetical protein